MGKVGEWPAIENVAPRTIFADVLLTEQPERETLPSEEGPMFASVSLSSPRNVALTGILLGLLVSAATICHADVVTTYTPGKVMPLSGCPTKVDTNPTSKTYGATVPDDQDAKSHGGANPEAPADDVCALVAFDVPPIPKGQMKTTGKFGGYGALVVTFSSPIDGASFFFAPACLRRMES